MVRAVIREVRELDANASTLLAPLGGAFDPSADPATACALLVDHLSMRRNKRCLLAYHRVRTAKLERLCWAGHDVLHDRREGGGEATTPADGTTPSGANAPSPDEEDYAGRYADLVAAWKGHWTDIDLGGSLEPPRELFIDVRVLKDAGEIQTEYGCVAGSIAGKCLTTLD